MPNTHLAIIIPGLGDDKKLNQLVLNFLTRHWKLNGIETYFFPVSWRDGQDFEPKLMKLLNCIDKYSRKYTISLVGISAGASLALNAYALRKNKVNKVINVCGRLRSGNHVFRSLERMAKTSIAFKQSVLEFEKKEKKLSSYNLEHVLTITPSFGDEIVPSDTVSLRGAYNKYVWSFEHSLSIGICLFFSKRIIEFIKS